MITDNGALTQSIRDRFAHVDSCPFTGPRIFFENAGGALTLKSAVETSTTFAAIPDNQGRDNPASAALVEVIKRAKADMALFFNAPEGQFFVGESGTELTFRLIRTAVMGSDASGAVIGSSVEHPHRAARHSIGQRWREYPISTSPMTMPQDGLHRRPMRRP
jgi:selenocysteine lyase/cysteine desulfurase